MKVSVLIRNFALPLLLALLAWGLFRLLVLRFAPGDVYPPYSTLRADPLGCKALYAAFQNEGGVKMERNFLKFPQITEPSRTTLFILGFTESEMQLVSKKEVEKLEHFINEGGDLIITFAPTTPEKNRKKW